MKLGKRILSLLLVTAMLLSAPITAFADTVLAIDIATLPNKLTYQEGEALDVTGGELTVYYASGDETIVLTEHMVSGFDSSVGGAQTLTVTYEGVTCTYDIWIAHKTAASISVSKLPTKLTYLEGKDALDVTGGELTVCYDDGTPSKTVPITLDMVSGFDNTAVGTQTLTVTYAGQTTTFDVEIQARSVSSISIKTKPLRAVYLKDVDALDITGGQIQVKYNNGTTEVIPMTLDMVSGFNNTTVGSCKVTVTYGKKTTSFYVTIAESNSAEFLGGLGTAERPYIIKTKEHLNNIRNYRSAHFLMIADIEFTEADFVEGSDFHNDGTGWQPIGISSSKAFTGNFDGNGHTITGLKINIASSSTIYAGLFGYVEYAEIKNLGMIDSEIQAETTSGTVYAGSIVGSACETTITGCYSTGSVTATSTPTGSAKSCAGGIAGNAFSDTTITNCYNTCSVRAASISTDSAKSYAGGIVGNTSRVTISNCYNTGIVTAEATSSSSTGDANAGGIVGYTTSADNGIIANCYNTGRITASSSYYAYAAGIAGEAYSASITDCYNMGRVSVTNASSFREAYAGGIAGRASGSTITDCYNTGSITASPSLIVLAGGIVGYAANNITITNCYNTGSVTATSIYSACNAYAGGVVGEAYTSSGSHIVTIANCYNTGNVTATSTSTDSYSLSYAGGIVGSAYTSAGSSAVTITKCYNTGNATATSTSTGGSIIDSCDGGIAGRTYGDSMTITNCYYLNNISQGVGDGTDTATQCTLEQMKQQATFVGFDFDMVWTMEGNADYPYPELQGMIMAVVPEEPENPVDPDAYQGLVEVDGIWGFYIDGVLQTDFTSLICWGETWFYVEQGIIDWQFTGLVPYEGNQFYVQNNVLDWGYTGLAWVDGVWTYVENALLKPDYTGLAYFSANGEWFYVEDGIVDWTFTGLVPYDGNYFYVQNNHLDWSYTGLGYLNDGWYYIENALLKMDYTGLTCFTATGEWFYVVDGTVDWTYTGMVPYNGNQFYVQNNHLDWGFTGLGWHEGQWYYFVSALWQEDYTGKIIYNDVEYDIVNGVAV